MTTAASAPVVFPPATPACFPRAFHRHFLEFLRDHPRIEVITFDDFPWEDDGDYEHDYPAEHKRWKKQLRSGARDPEKIYVVLQHDVDDAPERTHQVLRDEEACGVPSCTMLFQRRIDQQHFIRTGELIEKAYPIDDDYLRTLCAKGWLVGYHSNAYDQAGHDRARAMEIFEHDVARLRERFDVRYFCPHGGTRDRQGDSNACLPLPESLRASLRWVLNGHVPTLDASWSDGAINSWRKDALERDLRDFVRTWRPGRRYRVLTHPQYYDDAFQRSRRLAGIPWYEEMVAAYAADPDFNAWENVVLADETPVRSDAPAVPPRDVLPGRPIFIGGDGRSGTTLLAMVLDSHPELAVGPELHFAGAPNLGPDVLNAIRLIRRNDRRIRPERMKRTPELRPFVQFALRVQRAGIPLDELEVRIRQTMSRTGSILESFADRCVLIHELGEYLRTTSGKHRYGFKIMKEVRNPPKYAAQWPYAQFVQIIRDGRDVAASQMTEHGGWGYDDIEKAATGWVRVIETARKNAGDLPYHEVRYEDLILAPDATTRRLLAFLDVKWHDAVLNHHEADHAFFESSVNHPSRAQTQQPINDSAVGRYRRDLTAEQIHAFESIAGPLLLDLGYDIDPDAPPPPPRAARPDVVTTTTTAPPAPAPSLLARITARLRR